MPSDPALRTAARVTGGTLSVDLELTGAPPLLLPAVGITVSPVRVRLTYGGFDADAFVAVRVEGRDARGFVDYYDFNRRADWPQWLVVLVGEQRPATRDARVRAAAFAEAADATAAWAGDDTPMEDRPGYDGPVIDPEDRLLMFLSPDVPGDARVQLIAEYRQMVTDEIAALLRRLAATAPTSQEK